MVRLIVPSRETATVEVISDVVPSIFVSIKHRVSESDGIERATSWGKMAEGVLADLPRVRRGATSYTGEIGLPDSVVATRRETYGRFLDLCAPHVIEDANAIYLRDEKDACPVCNGNRLLTGSMARNEYGGCECYNTVFDIRAKLASLLAHEVSDDTLAVILDTADKYATEAFDSGRSVGFNSGMSNAADGW